MTIQISDNRAKYISNVIKEKIKEIENELAKNPLFIELKEAQATLFELEATTYAPSRPSEWNLKNVSPSQLLAVMNGGSRKYNNKASAIKKAEFVLLESGRPTTTKDIVNSILEYEPKLNRDLLVSNLSAGLGTKSKERKIFSREKNDLGEWEYSLLEWKKENQNENKNETENNLISVEFP